MESTVTLSESQGQFEDPLAYLPFSAVLEYRKGATIYSHDHASTSLFLVLDGRVSVSRISETGRQCVIGIYLADDFFGESAFLNLPHRAEQATALDRTKVIGWHTAQLTDLMTRHPRLAIALLKVLTRRATDMKERIESFCTDAITRRLARALLRFALYMGTTGDGGAIRMAPLTHEYLAQYVGTSREIVTYYMTRLRRQGYLQYSRKGITVFPAGLRRLLRTVE